MSEGESICAFIFYEALKKTRMIYWHVPLTKRVRPKLKLTWWRRIVFACKVTQLAYSLFVCIYTRKFSSHDLLLWQGTSVLSIHLSKQISKLSMLNLRALSHKQNWIIKSEIKNALPQTRYRHGTGWHLGIGSCHEICVLMTKARDEKLNFEKGHLYSRQ